MALWFINQAATLYARSVRHAIPTASKNIKWILTVVAQQGVSPEASAPPSSISLCQLLLPRAANSSSHLIPRVFLNTVWQCQEVKNLLEIKHSTACPLPKTFKELYRAYSVWKKETWASINHDKKAFWNICNSSLKISAAQANTEMYPWVWEHYLEMMFNDLNSILIDDTLEDLPVWLPVSLNEVKLLISRLKAGKAPGPDLVLPDLLKAVVGWWLLPCWQNREKTWPVVAGNSSAHLDGRGKKWACQWLPYQSPFSLGINYSPSIYTSNWTSGNRKFRFWTWSRLALDWSRLHCTMHWFCLIWQWNTLPLKRKSVILHSSI